MLKIHDDFFLIKSFKENKTSTLEQSSCILYPQVTSDLLEGPQGKNKQLVIQYIFHFSIPEYTQFGCVVI